MIGFEDGFDGVSLNYSSSVPSRTVDKSYNITVTCCIFVGMARQLAAFEICDSLIFCATHKT
jgi:hypothetical protein